jgi:hypothetical protein
MFPLVPLVLLVSVNSFDSMLQCFMVPFVVNAVNQFDYTCVIKVNTRYATAKYVV